MKKQEQVSDLSAKPAMKKQEQVSDLCTKPAKKKHEQVSEPLAKPATKKQEQVPNLCAKPATKKQGNVSDLCAKQATKNQEQVPQSLRSVGVDISSHHHRYGSPPENRYGTPTEIYRYGSPTENRYGTPTEIFRYGSPTEIYRYGSPLTENKYGSPLTENRYGSPGTENRFGSPIENKFGSPIENRFGSPIENRYGFLTESRYGSPTQNGGLKTIMELQDDEETTERETPLQNRRQKPHSFGTNAPRPPQNEDFALVSHAATEQPPDDRWVYKDESGTYRTGEAGYWVPVPGHPTAEQWVSVDTSNPETPPVKKGRCAWFGRRCGECWNTPAFRLCCIPLMGCLFCCGPPGWLLIWLIIKQREGQEVDDNSTDW